MDILASEDNTSNTVEQAKANIINDIAPNPNAVLGDTLSDIDSINNTNFKFDSGPQIVANETLDTSDESIVGNYKKIPKKSVEKADFSTIAAFMQKPKTEAEIKAAADAAKAVAAEDDQTEIPELPELPTIPEISESPINPELPEIPELDSKEKIMSELGSSDDEFDELNALPELNEIEEKFDPEKEAFIKTYTEEFDQTLRRATEAIESILSSIDATIREHLPEITITTDANEFLDEIPTDQKVIKFEDAQKIVQFIIGKANEAKSQSHEAAKEAAKVYDEVQSFKQSTQKQLVSLTDGLDLDELKHHAEKAKYSQPNNSDDSE